MYLQAPNIEVNTAVWLPVKQLRLLGDYVPALQTGGPGFFIGVILKILNIHVGCDLLINTQVTCFKNRLTLEIEFICLSDMILAARVSKHVY